MHRQSSGIYQVIIEPVLDKRPFVNGKAEYITSLLFQF